jgi:hypothetical protein
LGLVTWKDLLLGRICHTEVNSSDNLFKTPTLDHQNSTTNRTWKLGLGDLLPYHLDDKTHKYDDQKYEG